MFRLFARLPHVSSFSGIAAARSINGLFLTLLSSCSATPVRVGLSDLSEPPAPPSISPAEEACDEFFKLRDREAGKSLPVPGELRISAAKEHFRRAASFGFSGGLRILQNGAVRISATSGFADHLRRIPMSEEAVFDTGSVTKQFTGAAILRLEELGRLQTADPISKFFPDAPEDKRKITIHQLLSHQAGLRHSIGKMERKLPRDVAAKEILASALMHPVGSNFSYSNAGYALLAIIADKLSGSSYEQFLRDELWLPLGMTRTGMVIPDWSLAQVADGLEFMGPLPARVEEEWTETGDNWLSRGAAGVSSTLPDLVRWGEALRTGAILSESSRRKLFWPHVRMNTKSVAFYGYGWGINAAGDGSCLISHNGSAGIHYDVVTIFPQHATVVATFNTQQRTPWSANGNFVESFNPVITGGPLTLPETGSEPVDPAHAGLYELPSGERFQVVAESSRLKVPLDSVAALRLFAPWHVTGPAARDAPVSAATVERIVEGISRTDFRLLIERLPADIRPEAETDFWREYWPRWVKKKGAYRGADVIGTFTIEGAVRTLVRLRFARSSMMVAFVHSAGGKMFINTETRSFFPEIYLAPTGRREYLAFYPTTRNTISVWFGDDDVLVSSGGESAVARRTSR